MSMETPSISSNTQREEMDSSVPTRFQRKSIFMVLLVALLLVIGGVVVIRVVVVSKEDLSSQQTSMQNNSQGATNKPSLRPVTLPALLPSLGPTHDATKVEPTMDATISPSMKPVMTLPGVPSMAPTNKVLESPTTDTTIPASAWGSFEILQTYPHDRLAFTQGLELVPGNPQECFESTGLYGFSSLRRVDIATGQVLQMRTIDSTIFAEGVTYYEDEGKNARLIQLTWLNGVVFIYDAETFDLLEERIVPSSSTTSGEGWGICHVATDGVFYMTDGTAYLHKWNMTTLEFIDKVPVTVRETADGLPEFRDRLNEIEYDYHSNTILSNVWSMDYIVRIDPPTGVVHRRYDLTSLVNVHRGEGVLNGIAVTDTEKEILVTGKNWSNMYRIRLSDQ